MAKIVLFDCDANRVETYPLTGAGYEQALVDLRYWSRTAFDNLLRERRKRVWEGALEEGDAAYFLGIEESTASAPLLFLRASVRGGEVHVDPVLRACTRILRGYALP